MPKIHINTQHDYVSLVIEWSKDQRITLTTSFSATKATTKPGAMPKEIFNRIFKAYDTAMKKDGHSVVGNIGERTTHLGKIALGCHAPEVLAERFEAAVGAAPKLMSTVTSLTKGRLTPNFVEKVERANGLVPLAEKFPELPMTGEGSGKFVQRLWMAGINTPDTLVELVLKNYPGRTTTRSDIAYNVGKLRKQHGAAAVPAWPKKD